VVGGPFDVFVWLPRYFCIDRYWGFCFLLNYGLCLMKLEQKKYLHIILNSRIESFLPNACTYTSQN
jgi:hypothetical protein